MGKRNRKRAEPGGVRYGECLFCGGPADTKEDFVPDWYQQRLDPDNNRIFLPNDTAMRHRYAKVPACNADNGLFSNLENRISSGRFTEDEAYLWAFKVHAGFCLLRLRQRAVLSNLDSGVMPVAGPMQIWSLTGRALRASLDSSVTQFRRLVRIWKHHGTFQPSPLGSVFDLPSSKPGYRLIHAPCGYVAFNLGSRFLAVSLYDGGFAKQEGYDDNWSAAMDWRVGRIPSPRKSEQPLHFERFWLCSVAYFTIRTGWPVELSLSERDAIAERRGPATPRFGRLGEEEDSFLALGKQFGLHWSRVGDRFAATLWPRQFIEGN
jgi:hypothetical protein